MGSDDSSSTRTDGFRSGQAAAVVVLVLLCSSLLASVLSIVDPVVAAGAVVVPTGLAIALLWRLAVSGDSTTDREDGDDGSSVWNAIPSDQYDGRHAESGGIARGEQERALRDIQRQADELSDEPSQK